MILLDTNVLSELTRPRGEARVTAWMDAQAEAALWTTTITVAELRLGVALLPEGRRRAALSQQVEAFVQTHFAGRIAPFDLAATEHFAERLAAAERSGQRVEGFADAAIAAIALSRGWAVATRDTGPFLAMGVEVIDPWQG